MPKLSDSPLRAVPDDDTPPPPAKAAPRKAVAAKKAPAAKAAPARQEAPKTGLLALGRPLADVDDFVNGLWLGNAKTGKTTAVAHMANLGRVAYINAEGGVKRGPLARMGVNVDNIITFPPKPEDLTYQYLEDLFWELKGELEDNPGSWAGVVWDSLTEIHIKLLEKVRDYQNAKAIAKGVSRTQGNEAGDILDAFFTDLSDYGVMTEQLRQLLRKYRDLPCHFAVTTLIRRDVDKNDGKVHYRPALTPALGKDLVGYVDIIGVTDVIELGSEVLYRALYRPIDMHEGGDRFGVLPRRLYDPTFDRVAAYVNGQLTVESDSIMAKVAKLAASVAPTPEQLTGEDETPDVLEEDDEIEGDA